MMIAFASAMNASMTRMRRSVQQRSFPKPRLCQALVRSTTHRAPACSGVPFAEMIQSQPRVASRWRVALES